MRRIQTKEFPPRGATNMSRYSGRCDLFDSIYGGVSGWKEYFEAFEAFRKRTGGKLHQERKVFVTDYNLDDICATNPQLTYSDVKVTKTGKNGESREITERHFTYWGKEYNDIKKLNKKGVYVRIDIPFETVLDLIPYYPYVVACHYWSADEEMVILAKHSEVDGEIEDRLESGWFERGSIDFQFHCKHELAEHYREVIEELNRDLRSRRCQINPRDVPMAKDGDWYLIHTENDIDLNQPVEWFFPDGAKTHWTSPKYRDVRTIAVSAQDVEDYLKDAIENNGVYVRYVKRLNYVDA